MQSTSQDAAILHLADVTKAYPGGFALGPVNLSVAKGATLGVMGRNGAGKTTLFQLITGNLDRSSGKMLFNGNPHGVTHHETKRRIGYLPQDPVLPRWASADELLRYAATLYALPSPRRTVDEAITRWDVEPFRNAPVAACSYGMQKRIGLALATLHDPDLLVVDEPFSGLDLFHVRALEETLVDRAKRHRATIVSTHVPLHIAHIATGLILVRSGKVETVEGWQDMAPPARIAHIEGAFFT